MQPSSQDPMNPTGQSSPSFSSEQSSIQPQQDSMSPTGQRYQSSPYPQTEPPFTAPPPPLTSPQGSFPPGEEAYYNRISQDGGPITQYQAGTQGKLDTPPTPPRKPGNGWKVVSLILFILVLILGTVTTTLVLTRPTSSPNLGARSPEAQPTLATTQQPTSAATSSSVPTPAPTLTASSAALVASGTITENLLLTCGVNCNDPIHVTITTIQVNDASGTMTWNISLQNVSGSSMGYGIDTFELLASGTQTQIPANFSQKFGTLANSDPESIQGIFAFVPIQNTTYTLTVVVDENPFGGPQITFDPVQITNL